MFRKRRLLTATVLVLLVLSVFWLRRCHGPQQVPSGIFVPRQVLKGAGNELWAVRFAPGDTLAAAACVDSNVYVWNLRTGALLRRLPQGCGVTCLDFSADGRWLATTAYDGIVRLWSWPDGKAAGSFRQSERTVWTLRFAPSAPLLAAAGEDGAIVFWSVPEGKKLRTIAAHQRNVWDLAFDPSGLTIVSGSFDAGVAVWNVADGRLLQRLAAHREAVVSLAFAPGGARLITTSDDKTMKIWSTATWKEERSLATPEHQQGAAWSPNGRVIVSSGRDKDMAGELLQNFFGDETTNRGVSMRLWDAQTGRLLQTFSAHANDVNDVQFSRDGRRILSAGSDKKVILWERAQP